MSDLASTTGDVRPIELQIIGAQLESEQITTLIQYWRGGGKDAFVQRYLDGVVADCGAVNHRAAEFALFLLTDEHNTRPIKTQAQLESELGVLSEEMALREAPRLVQVLPIFVEAGIVVQIHEQPADRYQLVHDYLVPIIRHQQESEVHTLQQEIEAEKRQRQEAETQRDIAWQESQQHNRDLERSNRLLEKQRKRLVITVFGLLAVLASAFVLGLLARRSETEVMASQSEALLASSNELDASVKSLHALNRLQYPAWLKPILDPVVAGDNPQNLTDKTTEVLQEAFYGIREVNRLEGHDGAVRSISYSPIEKMIVTASDDETIRLWHENGRTYQNPEKLAGHGGAVYSVSFSPDGNHIAAASEDNTVKLWCKTCGWTCPANLVGHTAPVRSVSFSPDRRWIATGSEDRTVRIWSRDGQLKRTLAGQDGHTKRVRSVAFSPDSQLVASGSEDRTVKIWGQNGQFIRTLPTAQGHQDVVLSVSFSPNQHIDKQILATASADHLVKLWTRNGVFLRDLKGHSGAVRSVAFSPDGHLIATASDDQTVKIWGRDGQLLHTLQGHGDIVNQVIFRSNDTLATASGDTTVKLWKLNPNLLEHTGRITIVAASPDGRQLATASEGQQLATTNGENHVKLWDRSNSGQTRYVTSLNRGDRDPAKIVRSISFSPNNQLIATAGDDTTVNIWGRAGDFRFTLAGHTQPVRSVTFSPNNQLVASAGDDRKLILWNLSSRRPQHTISLAYPVSSIQFSQDGQTLITVSADDLLNRGGTNQKVQVWKLDGTPLSTWTDDNLKQLAQLNMTQMLNIVRVSPDGQTFAISRRSDKDVKLLNVRENQPPVTLNHKKMVINVQFSPDGQHVVTSSKDKIVKVWDLKGNPLKQFTWHYRDYFFLWFHTNNQIAMASSTGRIVLWDWTKETQEMRQLSCDQVRHYLENGQHVEASDRSICNNINETGSALSTKIR